jgi:hypothetical protein
MRLWPKAPPASPDAAIEEARLIPTMIDKKADLLCCGERIQASSASP